MDAMQLTTGIPFRGDLAVTRRDARTGRVIAFWEKKNVITFGAGNLLTYLLAPNVALGATIQQESQIKSMRFGTSSVVPQRSDTALGAEAVVAAVPVRIQLTDTDRVIGASGTVEFTAILDGSTGNGVTYREAGLFSRGTADDPQTTTGATMFSRQIYPDQPKTSAVELEYRWRITFSV